MISCSELWIKRGSDIKESFSCSCVKVCGEEKNSHVNVDMK